MNLQDYKEEYDSLVHKKNLAGEEALIAVRQHGYALQYVNEQTYAICLEAVRQHGYALQYVKEQTPEICLEAVKQNGYALQYVKEQTPEICLEAVKQEGCALRYVHEDMFDATTEEDTDLIELNGVKYKKVNN